MNKFFTWIKSFFKSDECQHDFYLIKTMSLYEIECDYFEKNGQKSLRPDFFTSSKFYSIRICLKCEQVFDDITPIYELYDKKAKERKERKQKAKEILERSQGSVEAR